MDLTQVLFLLGIGFAAGILSGMFGVGGGIIIVPALIAFLGMSQREAQGTSLALMLLPIGILAAWDYYRSGSLNIKYGLVIAGAFVIGGFLGSRMAHTFDETWLKRSFAVLMLAVAVKMFVSTYGKS
jgi:uncharacterized membrane protein YfcA